MIVHHTGVHPRHGIWENLCIGVDTEDRLVAVRGDTGTPPNVVEELVFECGHALVEHNFLQKAHQDHL
jgi:hypothetical protein